MKIAIGCDHIVTPIKDNIVIRLRQDGHEIIDCGTYSKVRTHYPIYGRAVGLLVTKGQVDCGVVICGTGVGISSSANKVKGIRCALVRDGYTAIKAKEEYNANIIGFGGQVLGEDSIYSAINKFLKAKYKGGNKELINQIDSQIHTLNDDPHLFDEVIQKWEKGEYTSGKKQDHIPLPELEKFGC